MRFVIQRVNNSKVTIDGAVRGQIGKGFMVLIGVGEGDTREIADKMIRKMINTRIFEDENGKTNLSLEIFVRIVEALQVSADWLIMADTPQSIECSSAELNHLFSDCSVNESKAILKMAEDLKSILRSKK